MISVIVPVYNAEKYIEECIESVLTQEYQDYELILINDGSADSSSQICEEYSQRVSKIKYINKENEGVSASRNLGIELAEGEYIVFVDADDVLKPNALDMIFKKSESNPNLIVYGFCSFGSGKVENDTPLLLGYADNILPETLLHSLLSIDKQERFRALVWRIAFQKTFLMEEKLRFQSGMRMSEDYLFVVQAVNRANTIRVISEELYDYRVNALSVTAKYIPTLHDDMNYVNEWITENVCSVSPQYQLGHSCCCAETYIVMIQNLCKEGVPYNFVDCLKLINKTRKKYNYTKYLYIACTQVRILTYKRFLVYLALWLHLEAIYVAVYRIKVKLYNATRRKYEKP